jgi:outer membrane lipoprotein SlyB
MNTMEQIKQAAFEDELQKIAVKNQVAAYGIRGSTIGAGVGSLSAAALATKLLNKVDPLKYKKTPIVAAAAIAGAIAGARIGGGMGAYTGGGVKGTYNLMHV